MLKKHPVDDSGLNDNLPDPSVSRANWITLGFAVLILTPSMIGFAMKFYEFMHTFRDSSEGAFAITPMVNYSLASLGFLCLMLWAAVNGTFRDMEAPKREMLERDMMLDRQLKEAKVTGHAK